MNTTMQTDPQLRETHLANLFLLALSTGALVIGPASYAQTFQTLYSFTQIATNGFVNAYSYGLSPTRLLVSDGTIYGATLNGGDWGSGTVFAIGTNGTDFKTLYSFSTLDTQGQCCRGVNGDGANPVGLVLSGGALYGTARNGGSGGGTVFALNTDGSGLTTLDSLSSGGTSPDTPTAGLALSASTLYATSGSGGDFFGGTVFAANTDGSGYTVLHSFGWPGVQGPMNLVLLGNSLYGMAYKGNGNTVFRVNTDGTGFATLYQFTNGPAWDAIYGEPFVVSDNTLYLSYASRIFALNTNGTGVRTVYKAGAYTGGPDTLAILGDVLYGTIVENSTESVFKVNTDGTGFAMIYTFTALQNTNSDGFYTNSDGFGVRVLISDHNMLYGATGYGGAWGQGTIFSISLPVTQPQLTISPVGANAILTWPTNAAGFTLQSTTNIGPSAVWTTNLPVPAIVNGQNTVTNPIIGTQEFYRLAQ